jgi:hypothetical protein
MKIRRGLAVLLVFGMILGVVAVGPGSERAEAVFTTPYSIQALHGYIKSNSTASYSASLAGAGSLTLTTGSNLQIGQKRSTAAGNIYYDVWRSFLSFDTTGITGNVQSATLYAKVASTGDFSWSQDFNVDVFAATYGATLTTGDWSVANSSIATLLNTAGGCNATWYSCSIPVGNINLIGNTQFELKSGRELTAPTGSEYVVLAPWSTGRPYLQISSTYDYGVTITYNFTASGMSDHSTAIQPTLRDDWNTTHDILTFQMWGFNQSWIDWYGDVNYTFSNIAPWGTVDTSAGGGYWNISATPDNCMLWVWCFVPKDYIWTTFHVSTSGSDGGGFSWETWRMYYSGGATFDSTNATRLYNSEIILARGENYTFAALDFFGNELGNATGNANVASREINIVIATNTLTIDNQNPSSVTVNLAPSSNLTNDREVIVAGRSPYYFDLMDIGENYTVQATFNQGGRSGETLWFNVSMASSDVIYIPGQFNAYIQVTNNLTGQGWPWGSWRVFWNQGLTPDNTSWTQAARDFVGIDTSDHYTFTALDLFGNQLGNHTILVDDPLEFVNISFALWPLTVENQNDDAVRMRLFRGGGAWPVDVDVPGRAANQENHLVADAYTITCTFIIGSYTNQTVWFNFTVSNTTYLRVNGTTITAIYVTLDGMVVYVEQMVQMLTPGMTWLMDNPALVPSGTKGGVDDLVIDLDPWMVMWGTVSMYDDGNGAATAASFNSSGMPGSMTFLRDRLRVSAPPSSYWLNDTENGWTYDMAGTGATGATYELAGNASAGSEMSLECDNLTYDCSLEREIGFRYAEMFNWSWNTNTNVYRATVEVHNDFDAAVTIQNPEIYVAFYPDTWPNLDSVVVEQDGIQISAGVNYVVDHSGVRFALASLAAGESHNFTIYYNGSSGPDPGDLRVVCTSYEVYTYAGQEMYMCTATATNTETTTLTGDMIIKLDFTRAEEIRTDSIIVYDNDKHMEVPAERWVWLGNTIVIYSDQLGDVSPSVSRSFSVMFLFGADQTVNSLLEPWFYLGGVPINIILAGFIVSLIAAVVFGIRGGKHDKYFMLAALAATVLLFAVYIFLSLVYYPTLDAGASALQSIGLG